MFNKRQKMITINGKYTNAKVMIDDVELECISQIILTLENIEDIHTEFYIDYNKPRIGKWCTPPTSHDFRDWLKEKIKNNA